MRANGFTEDKESREALEDPDAKKYLDFEISGNELDSDATVLADDEEKGVRTHMVWMQKRPRAATVRGMGAKLEKAGRSAQRR